MWLGLAVLSRSLCEREQSSRVVATSAPTSTPADQANWRGFGTYFASKIGSVFDLTGFMDRLAAECCVRRLPCQ